MVSRVGGGVKADLESLVAMWQDSEEGYKAVNHQVHILASIGDSSRKWLHCIEEEVLQKKTSTETVCNGIYKCSTGIVR